MNKGWRGESERHRLASYGIKSGRKSTMMRHIATKQERKKYPYLSQDSVVYKKPKITPLPKGCNIWDVEDPEGAGLTEKQTLQIWQHLVDTGQAWHLQGWYGRTAQALLDSGQIKYPQKQTYDYYGNPIKKRND